MSTKKHILALLECKRGQNISGEYIAGQLSISRNSVWKAIRELVKDGYRINAVTNKGYCLCEDNDILSVEGMLPFLSPNIITDRIRIYDSLESTNKTAKELAISGAEHGTTVIADCQTSGRGRYNRQFFSPPGCGIYMSVILRPDYFEFDIPSLATASTAVSVCEAIEASTSVKPQIKWVNDIFLDGKKICGILTEAVTDFESGTIQWIVAGIGINFNTPDFPEDLRLIAGSVFADSAPSTTRNRIIAEILNRMLTPDTQYGQIEMLEQYKLRMMMLGKKISVSGPNETYEAVAVDVDDTGRLVVKKDTGDVISLSAGEITV